MASKAWLMAAGMTAALMSANPAGGQAPAAPTVLTRVAGYLPTGTTPGSLTLLPPPPTAGSGAQARDEDGARAALALHGGPRWDLATQDADLSFPNVAGTFSCAIGAPVTEVDTPALFRLLQRSLSDIGLSTYPTKTRYQRARPFTVNNRPMCTPALDAGLRKDGSYPSGHSAIGWGWGLIVAEVVPDRIDAVLARGRAYSDSRRVCNVHWQSDVDEGRTMGAAVVARLHDSAEFRADVATAKAEVIAARAKGLKPNRDCAEEARRLAAG